MRTEPVVVHHEGGERPRIAGDPRRHPLRVQSVPSQHSYPLRLRAVATSNGRTVLHLPDPVVPGAEPGRWWPPPALDRSWLRRHGSSIDVVHLHFGFDHLSPRDLLAWTAELRRQRLPLVLTLHDLVNPHFVDQQEHLARLDVLVPAAAAVLTLTKGAATQIRRRWSSPVSVTPHPHVVPDHLIGAERGETDGPWVVGLHLKGLRANIAARPMVTAAVEAVGRLPDAVLRVDVNAEVWRPDHPRHDPTLVKTLHAHERAGRLDLRVHEIFTDDELFAYLRAIDVSLLPYAFGTHSGWVEACHDLGTVVVAPRTGFWVEQQPMLSFGWAAGGEPNVAEIASALRQARQDPPCGGVDRAARTAEQVRVSQFHDTLYCTLHEAASSRTPS